MPKATGSFKASVNWQTTIPQRDVAGHEVSMVEIAGVHRSEDPDWNHAHVTYWGVGDAISGNGSQTGYYITTRENGVTDRGTFEARITTADGKTTMEGTWKMTGGTGKFNGATGAGAFRTRMVSPTEVECSWEGEYQTVEAKRGAGR